MKKSRIWFVSGIAAALLFIWLVISVKNTSAWLENWDVMVQKLVAPDVNSATTSYISLIALLGSPLADLGWTVLIAFIVWSKEKSLVNASWLIITQLSGCAVALLAKEFVHRARPNNQVIKESGFSFPSGHTFATAIVVLAILAFVLPLVQKQEIQLVIFVLSIGWLMLIGFTRLYLRAHFFSDICGSVLLAIFWWEVMRLFYFKVYSDFFKKIRLNIKKNQYKL